MQLYEHDERGEKGRVEIVAETDEDLVLLCKSLKAVDRGVIYPIMMEPEDVEELIEAQGIETIEGCVIKSTPNRIRILRIPDEEIMLVDPHTYQVDTTTPMLQTSRFWQHRWGRCCCVHHHGQLEPVTVEKLFEAEASWWPSPLTPYQLDLLSSLSREEGLHVLEDRICPRCEMPVWVVEPEDLPEVLPHEAKPAPTVTCAPRSPADSVPIESMREAWTTFSHDPHNAAIIRASGRPLTGCPTSRRRREKKAFAGCCALLKAKQPAYAIRTAFLLALPKNAQTWAELRLDALQAIEGLSELQLPVVVRQKAGLDETDEIDKQAESLEKMFYFSDEDLDENDFVDLDPSELEELLAAARDEATEQGSELNLAEITVLKPAIKAAAEIARKGDMSASNSVQQAEENLLKAVRDFIAAVKKSYEDVNDRDCS